MKIVLVYILVGLLTLLVSKAPQSFDGFTDKFVTDYKAMQLPPLDLSYVDDIKKIQSLQQINKQSAFFESVKSALKKYKLIELTPGQKTDYELISYETKLNLQRLALEQQWKIHELKAIPTNGIHNLPNGKAWYLYLLKNWLSADVNVDEIYKFGMTEVNRVNQHINIIQKETGLNETAFYKHLNDKEFYIIDKQAVQDSFEHKRAIIYNHLNHLFSYHNIPALKIEAGANQALAQAPGYYDNNIFIIISLTNLITSAR